MKIVITDAATVTNGDINLSVFGKYGETEIYDFTSQKELLDRVKDAEILLCNKSDVTKEVIDSAKNLKYIGLFATGYNNIDVKYAKQKGIVVSNAPAYSTNAVAQLVFAFISEYFGKISDYTRYSREGKWKKSRVFSPFIYETREIAGKTIGIIGYGSIGKAVAKIANAYLMNVLVYTRTPQSDDTVTFVDFDTLIKKSDIITVHCPLSEDTKNMFNESVFAKMKRDAFFINTARGAIVDENALANALVSHKIGGAALDVLCAEPMANDCILQNTPNIMITPHIAWAPYETRTRLIKTVENNLVAFLSGKPQNVVS